VTAQELLDNIRGLLRVGAIEPTFASLMHCLADHVYEARLDHGQRVLDASDFSAWLRELAEASRCRGVLEATAQIEATGKLDAPSLANLNAEIRRTRIRLLSTCPDCGHVHQVEGTECGQELGGGRVCRCDRRVIS